MLEDDFNTMKISETDVWVSESKMPVLQRFHEEQKPTQVYKTKSKSATMGLSVKYFWFGKSGHIAANCRRKLGVCLICGSKEHFLKDCPNGKRPSPKDFTHVCPKCNGAHLGMFCHQHVLN